MIPSAPPFWRLQRQKHPSSSSSSPSNHTARTGGECVLHPPYAADPADARRRRRPQSRSWCPRRSCPSRRTWNTCAPSTRHARPCHRTRANPEVVGCASVSCSSSTSTSTISWSPHRSGAHCRSPEVHLLSSHPLCRGATIIMVGHIHLLWRSFPREGPGS